MNSPLPSNIKNLSISERIQLVQDIWDSIIIASDFPPITDPQRHELERRLDLYRQNPDSGSTWDEVKHRIDLSS